MNPARVAGTKGSDQVRRRRSAGSAPSLSKLPPEMLLEVARRATAAGVDLRAHGTNGSRRGALDLEGNVRALRVLAGVPEDMLRVPRTANAAETAFRCPFRLEGGALAVLDQRRFPAALVEVRCRSAAEAIKTIGDGLVQGAGSIAAVGCYSLALAAGSEDRQGEPAAAQVAAVELDAQRIVEVGRWIMPLVHSMDRLAQRARTWAARGEEGSLSEVLTAEAHLIVAEELVRALRAIATGAELLTGQAARAGGNRRLRVLVHGPLGALANGLVGFGTGSLEAANTAGLRLHVWIAEGRPPLTGVRTAWELLQAGVAHGLVPDSSVPGLISARDVDIVLLGSLSVTSDGEVIDEPGGRAVAEEAARQSMPVYVFARTSGLQAAHTARGDGFDITPPSAISGFVTDAGLVTPPFAAGLARAAEAFGSASSSSR